MKCVFVDGTKTIHRCSPLHSSQRFKEKNCSFTDSKGLVRGVYLAHVYYNLTDSLFYAFSSVHQKNIKSNESLNL